MSANPKLQMLQNAFAIPTYTYIIHNDDLGLYYIGKHAGVWANGPDYYMGSSSYLNAVRSAFPEYVFQKDLLSQFSNDEEASKYETDAIQYAYKTDPAGLLNRSANDALGQFEHLGYGKITKQADKDRLDAARREVRKLVLKTGEYKCLILVKMPDGTAHAPAMPWRNLTPIPAYGNWSKEMLEKYNSLPPGCHHFASILDISKSKNYRPLMYVESFASEEEARECGSFYANLPSAEYVSLINSME